MYSELKKNLYTTNLFMRAWNRSLSIISRRDCKGSISTDDYTI